MRTLVEMPNHPLSLYFPTPQATRKSPSENEPNTGNWH